MPYKHIEDQRAAARRRYRANPDRQKAATRACNDAVKTEVFSYYGQGQLRCNCCGTTYFPFLTLDHIANNGAEHRKELGTLGVAFYRWLKKHNFPPGFQI